MIKCSKCECEILDYSVTTGDAPLCDICSAEFLVNFLKERIAKLESEKAELQRVVQIKDEALDSIMNSVSGWVDGTPDASQFSKTANYVYADATKALETTPTNLPKFIPEAEYLRVNGELLKAENFEALFNNLKTEFALLKSHAEAMANKLETHGFSMVKKYRKDFPKEEN